MTTASTALPAPPTALPLTVLSACCQPAPSGAADQAAQQLADLFKALSDPARVKIMAMLLNAEEVCACDISAGIGKSAPTTSHHLSILRKAGLLTGEKRGTWMYYRAVPERLSAIVGTLALTR